jgi:hypothetical protein
MFKIAFFDMPNKGWLGGVNYYNNLFNNLKMINDIDFVIIDTGDIDRDLYVEFNSHIVSLKLLFLFNKITNRIFNYNLVHDLLAYKVNADLMWQSSGKKFLSKAKKIFWFGDLQDIHLPQFFSKKELNYRKRLRNRVAKYTDYLLLSSDSVRKDYLINSQYDADRIFVYRFNTNIDITNLKSKPNIGSEYIYVPNQFWKHKNHMLLLKALKIVKEEYGKNYLCVFSGNTNDYRNQNYYSELIAYINKNDLSKNCIMLGLIPYSDVLTNIYYSKVIVNPSLFEGWSTCVEEAKVLGKRLVLSDIDVHKEQAPNAIFFDRNDERQLAESIIQAMNMDYTHSSIDSIDELTKKSALKAQVELAEILSSIREK